MFDGVKIIQVMQENGFRVLARNIVYIGSCDLQGNLAPQQADEWRDVRVIVTDKGEVIHKAIATIRPGKYYMDNPMNDAGCAMVAYGQHRNAWTFGTHGRSYPHEALMQCDNIKVHRVEDGSFSRESKPVTAGAECGINQHSTRAGYSGKVHTWSASCLVVPYTESHRDFIRKCRDTGNRFFDTTVLPWRLVFGDGSMNPGVAPLVGKIEKDSK